MMSVPAHTLEAAGDSSTPPGDADTAQHTTTSATRSPKRTTGNLAKAWIIATLGLIGVVLGAWWQDTRGVPSEAFARVAFAEEVSYGDLDAVRSIIVDDGSAVRAGEAVDGVQHVELIVPGARSHIDVVVEADNDEAAVLGADAVVAQLIAASAAIETADAEAALTDVALSITEIDAEIAALEASMLEELTVEAAAEAALTEGPDSQEREALTIEARLANDTYWSLTRERNALLDQRNSYVRTQSDSEIDLRNAGNLRVVEQSTSITAESLDPRVSGAIGGGLLGVGVAIFGFWLLHRPRETRA